MNQLDPQVLAHALAEKIDRDLSSQLDSLIKEAESPGEVVKLIFRAQRAATETLLTQLLVLLPDGDRECVVKLFKLHSR